ncbi:MAG: RsmF rRNA methyltransferase first C-terminal domain-containing protein [Clostridia bacterium]|nr:RsmF rRNA methyltransferase first C-terminal domain-containing protein [Clostridia bacterium]
MEKLSEKLPVEFLERQKKSLGKNFDLYINAVNLEPCRGLRVNTLKIQPQDFEKLFTEKLEKLPFSNDGYILESDEKIGNCSEHISGLIYLQEPSSMIAVCASGIKNENRPIKVLDLCASPGGKSGQIASRISKNSVLFSNEIIKKRASVLYSNLERLGVRNAIILNEEPERLAIFEGYFDYVFVDAPCSGEGMFRKNPETIVEWSKENVEMCAARQKEILNVAQKLVKTGGKLIYSTCTFSPEEDEENVDWFLKNFNFSLCEIPTEIKNVSCGVKLKNGNGENARKFYPFSGAGEGQFVAVFKNNDEFVETKIYAKKHFKSIDKSGRKVREMIEDFYTQNLTEKPDGQVFEIDNNLYLAPVGFDEKIQTALDELKFVSFGVKLGEIIKDRFEPNHAFFMAYGNLFKTKIEVDDENFKRFLHGEELSGLNGKGFGVITKNGYAVGGVRISGGKLKNLYPRGLRS